MMARRSHTMMPTLLLLVCLAGAAPRAARACLGTPVVTSGSFATAQPIDTAKALSLDGVKQVLEHFAPIGDYRPNTKSTFSCVDSRGNDEELGTLGGDFAELAAAIAVFAKTPGMFDPAKYSTAPSAAFAASNANKTALDNAKANMVASVFNAFMRDVASPSRPFYYHTSSEKMEKVFKTVKELTGTNPVIMPARMPADGSLKSAWLTALAKGANQGCGHVRLMIEEPDAYAVEPVIPKTLVKAFFNYWWHTPAGSAQRDRALFVMKEGGLDGRAIALVTSTGGCKGQSPALAPARDGAQIFVVHPEAVKDFRKDVVTPFFVKYARAHGKTLDAAKFYSDLEALHAKHLGATLRLLSPANALPLWSVEVKTTEDAAPAKMRTRNARN